MADLFKKTLEFLSICDGYHELCKGLHWSADKNSLHVLTDNIDGSILEYQDKIAEIVMGLTGQKFQPGQLRALISPVKDCKAMLNEMESDVCKFKAAIGDDVKMSAIHNVLDDMLSDIYKWKYLETLS